MPSRSVEGGGSGSGYGKVARGVIRTLERYQLSNVLIVEMNYELVNQAWATHTTFPLAVKHRLTDKDTEDSMPRALVDGLKSAVAVFSATGQKALTAAHLQLLRKNCLGLGDFPGR